MRPVSCKTLPKRTLAFDLVILEVFQKGSLDGTSCSSFLCLLLVRFVLVSVVFSFLRAVPRGDKPVFRPKIDH